MARPSYAVGTHVYTIDLDSDYIKPVYRYISEAYEDDGIWCYILRPDADTESNYSVETQMYATEKEAVQAWIAHKTKDIYEAITDWAEGKKAVIDSQLNVLNEKKAELEKNNAIYKGFIEKYK